MERILNVVGRNSGEVFMVKYPRALLNFCEYDLAYFAENAIALCDEALRAGELDFDRVTELRNSLKGAHVYIENNIRSVYDKIVLDCWIDYVCRRDNVGTSTLWNRFMSCNTAFEKAVFVRLCDYRYHRGINEWLNLVRVQDYAKSKINFIFSVDITDADHAAARRNYFDLMFSVTARELGCRIEELGVTKVFSIGRTPSSPFMYPNISKDIMKNLLSEFDYSEDYSDTDNYIGVSDQIAMDAFSYMKSGLAQEYNSYNISRSEMTHSPMKVYMPCGLKAVVDLEIDALLESGGWLARCKRCGRYFVRDAIYTAEYCSLFTPGGKTCLQIYEMEHPKANISTELEQKYTAITDEMYSRVGDEMSLKDYESWKVYLDALHEKVEKGEIPSEELEAFIGYSWSMDISRSNPVREVVKKQPERISRERVVKPFVPQRIDRSELEAQTKPSAEPIEEDYEDEYEFLPQQRGKSFFTSPSVQQRQSSRDTQVTRIIRAEQSAEVLAPKQNTFTPFGQQEPVEQAQPAPSVQPAQLTEPPLYDFEQFGVPTKKAEQPVDLSQAEPEDDVDYERVAEMLRILSKADLNEPHASVQPKSEKPAAAPIQEPKTDEPAVRAETPVFDLFGDVSYETSDNLETFGNVFDLERDGAFTAKQPAEMSAPLTQEPAATQPAPTTPTPKTKVIRKNARAISAYGKMSGAPVVSAASFNAVSAQTDEPFKDVGAIFDELEASSIERPKSVQPEPEYPEAVQPVYEQPVAEPETEAEQLPERLPPVLESPKSVPVRRSAKNVQSQPHEVPEKVDESNAPSGIWTEERNLFPEPDPEELEMLKEKKRTRSAKTQRLFDAIMREPEDNPNVRKKKGDN